VAAVLLASMARAPAPVAHAQAAPETTRNPLLGLAHVDVPELHVTRSADGPPVQLQLVSASVLAERYRQAAASGASWNRWSAYWDLSDRGGAFDWSVTDGIAERDVAHGLRSLVVLHGNPPGVAHLDGAPPGIQAPVFVDPGGALTDDPVRAAGVNPGNGWARFVAAAVEHYRPGGTLAAARGWRSGQGVRHWQIGNEPNSPSFWRGTAADFARYLEVGYLAAKWVDPGATVAHGGIANDANAEAWFGAFLDALLARAAASPLPQRHGYYYDRTAWHWYTTPSNLTVAQPWRVRQMHAERGLPDKALWVTEFGAAVWSEHPGPCWDPDSPGRVTAAEQAAFVWQSLAEGLAAGAELMVYFQLYDDCGNGHDSYDAFGLLRNHTSNQCWAHPGHGCWSLDPAAAGAPRPAYEALRTAARELSGARPAEVPAARDGVRRVVFARPGSARVTVAWNTTGRDRTAALPASTSRATLFELDASGAVVARGLDAHAGQYRVFLAGATNRNGPARGAIVAGRPVLIVESGVADRAAAPSEGPAPPLAPVAPGFDTVPPAALVGALPETTQPLFELQVLAADEQSGLDAYQVLFAVGQPPTSPDGWTPYLAPLPWPGALRYGEARLPFVGAPGHTYYFAAVAADRAGNWSATPDYAQARTTILAAPRPRVEIVEAISARRQGVAQ